jgi:hypothetical protein
MGMDSIKARIQGDGVDTSVEFSVEEVMARRQGKPWAELTGPEQEAAMRDYALGLHQRDGGMMGELRVTLEPGTFSSVRPRDV